tara:strand:+ start:2530 stop:3351 length:822 start_codon:yes stop_codon:yes gene_type:complete
LSDTFIPDPVLPCGRGTRILAIANQKGGVGKTTTAVNVGTALAAINQQVLLIDLDPQGNASTGLGIAANDRKITTYDIIIGNAEFFDSIRTTEIPRFDIITSGSDLYGAEVELIGLERREYKLHDSLIHAVGAYDYILIDCPPALGLLTINALVAAQAVLVPVQCEFYALEGISHLVATVERVREAFNSSLNIQGIILTMYDQRNNLSNDVAEDVRGYFGNKVYNTVIPRNVRISEAPSHGLPVLIYDMQCAGAQAYLALAGEIIHRERNLTS